jgi:transcriptional regulator with XRE-family HTH domain
MVKQPMQSAKTDAASAAAGNRTKLNLFGKFLKTAREKTIPTQQEASLRLTEAGHPASQSLIAQLETGRISNPDAGLLKKLAEVYKVSYKDLINCLSLDKYGVNDDDTSQLCQDLMGDRLLAPETTDSMAAHRTHSKLTFFKYADVLDVEGMAEWQKDFKELKNYWVIAPDFVDDRVKSIREAVIHNLKRGVNITYFVTQGEEKPGGRFQRFKRNLDASLQQTAGMGYIRAVPVPVDYLRWLVADMVVANPDIDLVAHPEAEGAVGYLVVRSEGGGTAFGVRMRTADVEKTVNLISPYAEEVVPERSSTASSPPPVAQHTPSPERRQAR